MRSEQGQTLAEYAVTLGVITVGAVLTITVLGGNLIAIFETVAGAIG